MFKVYFII